LIAVLAIELTAPNYAQTASFKQIVVFGGSRELMNL